MRIKPLKQMLDEVALDYASEVISLIAADRPTATEIELRTEAAKVLGISLATLYRLGAKAAAVATRGGAETVYVMRDNATGAHKIGRTKGVPQIREKTLQSEKPSIELLFHGPGSRSVERVLHNRYAPKRMRGEWFRLTAHDLEQIRGFLLGE